MAAGRDRKTASAIEEAAQSVLDVRVKYPVSSLADLYDPRTMPPDLVKAQQKLDAAVDAAFSKKKFFSDTDHVAFLFLPGMIAPALLDAAAAGLSILRFGIALDLRPPLGGISPIWGGTFDSENGKDDERGTTRESPLALGTLAQGPRHRPKPTGKTAVACGRRQPLAWYRRRKRAQQAAAMACACATFERAEAFAAALTRDLARCAAFERESLAILAELTALTAGGSWQAMV